MAEINRLDLDLYPTYIPFIVQCTTAVGSVSNPTVDNLIIYEEGGADGTFDNSTIAGSPFDPVQFNAKTGSWGKMIAKSAFTAGKFYIALWEMTVDGETTAKIEVYFAVNASQYMADVTNLDVAVSSRAPASEYDTEMGRIDVVLSTRSSHTAANVWSAGSRELSTPNNYKADVSALATTAALTDVEDKIDDVYDNTDDIIAKADFIKIDTGTILIDTNEIQTKLPDNNIMGSSVKTDKDDEIDAIKLKTDNLPSDPGSETNATVNKTEIITEVKKQSETRRTQEN